MPVDSMEDTPAGRAARVIRKEAAAKAEAERQALRDEGAAAERARIVTMLREEARSCDDLDTQHAYDGRFDGAPPASAALERIADELESEP